MSQLRAEPTYFNLKKILRRAVYLLKSLLSRVWKGLHRGKTPQVSAVELLVGRGSAEGSEGMLTQGSRFCGGLKLDYAAILSQSYVVTRYILV